MECFIMLIGYEIISCIESIYVSDNTYFEMSFVEMCVGLLRGGKIDIKSCTWQGNLAASSEQMHSFCSFAGTPS